MWSSSPEFFWLLSARARDTRAKQRDSSSCSQGVCALYLGFMPWEEDLMCLLVHGREREKEMKERERERMRLGDQGLLGLDEVEAFFWFDSLHNSKFATRRKKSSILYIMKLKKKSPELILTNPLWSAPQQQQSFERRLNGIKTSLHVCCHHHHRIEIRDPWRSA